MKHIQCEHCGRLSPSRLLICPYCDYVLKKRKENKNGLIALMLFWGFNAVMAIWHISHWTTTASILRSKTELTNTGHVVTSAINGSFEIIVYWLLGFFILGIWVVMTRE